MAAPDSHKVMVVLGIWRKSSLCMLWLGAYAQPTLHVGDVHDSGTEARSHPHWVIAHRTVLL